MKKVNFFLHDKNPGLKNKKRLKGFIQYMFIKEKKELNMLSYIFCSDKYLLKKNREFLKHDFYTDVITFDLSINDKEIEGEVYISVDRIKENAREAKVTINNELHRVIFHGALHLCGYKDKSKTEIKNMRRLEEKYLKEYFYEESNRFT